MGYIIKKVETKELENAFSLIWNTFSEFIAPDYTEEAVVNFRVNFIENEDFKECFKNGNQIMYGAYLKERLVGVISIKENKFVSCFFVDKEHHRNGIATMLFNHMVSKLKQKHVDKITLNASPYAVPFYRAIGFKDLDEQQEYKGILYTPMEFIL